MEAEHREQGAESSREVAGQLDEAKAGSEGVCALPWGSCQPLVCACLFPGPHTPPVAAFLHNFLTLISFSHDHPCQSVHSS